MTTGDLIPFVLVASFVCGLTRAGILYPRESESREVKSLDGIWNFKLPITDRDAIQAFNEKWFLRELKDSGPTIPMPVPSSYNDLTQLKEIRDYVGVVWYDRTFFVPTSWSENQRVWLRFGSVCYAAQVWLNGHLAMSHEIGHLPFVEDVTQYLKFGQENLITVAVDNVLLQTTVPQGYISELVIRNRSTLHQSYTFDFFNYAGIDRPVLLYTTPEMYIDDVTVSTDVDNGNGVIYFEVDYRGVVESDLMAAACKVVLLDKEGHEIGAIENCAGKFTIISPNLWWPFLMHPSPGYLYQLRVELSDIDNTIRDIYRLPVGIRKLTWSSNQVHINGHPLYIRGVGKHEDSDIRGKGLDLPLVVKDFNLLQWLGVNTFRTSHYPYAEEIMDMADSMGIMVIDECPSVNTEIYSDTLRQKHERSLTELFHRDKNRPSVIMWSLSNEARTQIAAADNYFRQVSEHMRSLDVTRPITMVLARRPNEDKTGQYLDVILFNRYNSWYTNTGETDIIYQNVIEEAQKWHYKYDRPVIMAEYGADAVAGLHIYPESVWSEEFQIVMMEEHFKAFDYLRAQKFFIGEMIWNFADFQTAQTTGRVGGNKKGVFTRQRQPKGSAFVLRRRYLELAYEIENVPLPANLYTYTSRLNITVIGNS
ncbi:hypothetical protein RUM43_005680 [Polyplax serrata]|uniref:Beta-glucuronidase n=1 Tax=Polyplax serrata TaxID=468196 RepID=A0AAN8NRN8_POLSC